MEKFTVEEIKNRAVDTMKKVKGQRGTNRVDRPIALVQQWRFYCKQVLFLCKEVEKRDKKIELLSKK